jgi:nucleoid-associated protein YgaU
MKALAVGLSGAALLALVAGCSPQLAETELGDKEMQWNSIVRESYPGFRPPRTAPPAVKDKNTPLQSVVPENELQPAAPAPAVTDETQMVETVTNEAVEDVSGKPELVKETVTVDETVDATAAQKAASPVAEPKPEGKFTEYVVKPGDSLSGIAKKVYKDGRLYDRIYEANKSVIPNPNRLPVGLKIRIPQL